MAGRLLSSVPVRTCAGDSKRRVADDRIQQPRSAASHRPVWCWRRRAGPARAAALLLLTMPGTPFVYYGEELGMRNGRLRYRDLCDPYTKRFWPFRPGRDPARTPMQWTRPATPASRPASPGFPWPRTIGSSTSLEEVGDPQVPSGPCIGDCSSFATASGTESWRVPTGRRKPQRLSALPSGGAHRGGHDRENARRREFRRQDVSVQPARPGLYVARPCFSRRIPMLAKQGILVIYSCAQRGASRAPVLTSAAALEEERGQRWQRQRE